MLKSILAFAFAIMTGVLSQAAHAAMNIRVRYVNGGVNNLVSHDDAEDLTLDGIGSGTSEVHIFSNTGGPIPKIIAPPNSGNQIVSIAVAQSYGTSENFYTNPGAIGGLDLHGLEDQRGNI